MTPSESFFIARKERKEAAEITKVFIFRKAKNSLRTLCSKEYNFSISFAVFPNHI